MTSLLPAVSIVLCTRNRADSLGRTLDAISRLDRTGIPALELVVVDNGSTDGTPALLEGAQRSFPFPLVTLRTERKGAGRTRNRGVLASHHPLILMTDDDCLPRADWLVTTASLFGDDLGQVIVGAFPDVGQGEEAMARFPHGRLDLPAELFGPVQGGNMSFGRVVFDRIGGFDVCRGVGARSLDEDVDFAYRAHLAGFPVRYEPASFVLHDHRRSPIAIERRMREYFFAQGSLALKLFRRDRGALTKVLYWRFLSELRGWRQGHWSAARPASYAWAVLRGAVSALATELLYRDPKDPDIVGRP